jgi:hypothetical protein
MAIEGFRMELLEEWGLSDRVSTKTEQVFKTELVAFLLRQEVWCSNADDLISQCPQRVETESLVAGGIGDDICILPVRIGEVVIHAAEKNVGNEPPRGDGASWVT